MKFRSRILLCFAASTLGILPVYSQETPEPSAGTEESAQKSFDDFINSLSWQKDGIAQLGSRAQILVPDGYRFTGSGDTSKLMEYYGNLSNGSELGYIAPIGMEWFAVFQFEEVGYVKDDEKDKLDADKILKDLQEGQQAANNELIRLNRPTLTVNGWHTKPFYNTKTNNLEWAIRLSSSGGEILNYKTKLLGRHGVMDVVLVCSEEQLASVVPQYQELLEGFSYKKEESYAAYTKGDKIAEYGLIGLISGGGLLLAAKTGLLAKLWKPIAIGLVAIGAFLKRIFKGNTKESI
ncbi:MAG: DUF2167 domain-containing protein [Armatimonadetes bacterium]|nr:DUF2167 domain-containing protein [Akkermansiaceae bacterium]